MAPAPLEREDHSRDAAFNKAMHMESSKAGGGFNAMLKKDKVAHKAAVDEYFKHWDNKAAKDETAEDREVESLHYSVACANIPLSVSKIRICYFDKTVCTVVKF